MSYIDLIRNFQRHIFLTVMYEAYGQSGLFIKCHLCPFLKSFFSEVNVNLYGFLSLKP